MAVRRFILMIFLLAAAAAWAQPSAQAPASVLNIDRVVAVVNDEAITQYDVDDAKRIVLQQLRQQKVEPPAADVLEKQVLERLITERALLQFAKDNGIKVDDTQVERTIQRIAQDNKLAPDEFRQVLAREVATRLLDPRNNALGRFDRVLLR